MFTFTISRGTIGQNGELLDAHAYSGQPQAKNDPARVREHCVGPIPPGTYKIGPAFTDAHKGPFVMRLEPLIGTDTFGRDGFMIHGDSIIAPGTASEGCVITSLETRVKIAAARDRVLRVVA